MRKLNVRTAMFPVCAAAAAFLTMASPAEVRAETTSQVAISLSVKDDGKQDYVPGEVITYELNVNNLLGESWVRVNLDFSGSTPELIPVLTSAEVDDDWVMQGGKLYYKNKVAAHSTEQVVHSIRVPDVSQLSNGGNIVVKASAEAIAAGSVKPNFTKEDPWFGKYGSGTGWSGSTDLGNSLDDDSECDLRRYDAPVTGAEVVSGSWECSSEKDHIWKCKAEGRYLKDGWYYISDGTSGSASWYHFNSDSKMDTGWYRTSNGVWYHLHTASDGNLGKLDTGWYTDDQDGCTYYFDTVSGVMLSGEQTIGGTEYRFQTYTDTPGQSWFYNTSLGKWIYTSLLGVLPYGALIK